MDDLNFLVFLSLVFRLKTLTIYMDKDNDDESKIKTQLAKLNQIKYSYLAFTVVFKMFEYVNSNYLYDD